MQVTINNIVVVQKPSKAKEASIVNKLNLQRGSSNMEEFDYKIPHTPPNEVILHTIIIV